MYLSSSSDEEDNTPVDDLIANQTVCNIKHDTNDEEMPDLGTEESSDEENSDDEYIPAKEVLINYCINNIYVIFLHVWNKIWMCVFKNSYVF